MPQNELRRRRVQLEKLAAMREQAQQDDDGPRVERINAGIQETEQRIAELEAEQAQAESGEPRRRRR